MKKLIISFIITLAVGLFGYTVFGNVDEFRDVGYRIAFGTTLAMGATAIITSGFLFASLKELKTNGRQAYIIIATGILLYVVAQLSQPAVALLLVYVPTVTVTPVQSSLVFVIPFLLSAFALYMGTRKLAAVLDIKMMWMSITLVLSVSVAAAIASVFLPHSSLGDPELDSMRTIFSAAITFGGFVVLFGSAIAFQLKTAMNSAYRSAMNWLALSLAMLGFAVLQEVVFKGTDLIDTPYVSYSLNFVPFLLAGLLFLKAGHGFQAATRSRLADNATFIDAVIYASQQVSNPVAIDSVLDDLRIVTASMQKGTKLTQDKIDVLMRVYLQIEAYLESKEPIRNITATGLRARMTPEFLAALDKYESPKQ